MKQEVRLARLDAVDVGTVKGQFDAVVADHVIVVSASCLQAMSRTGVVTVLGQLAGAPGGGAPGSVAVSPDLASWIYTVDDSNWTAHVHLGTPSGDRTIADLPSPDGNATWVPLAWRSSGIYFVKQPTGLGGAGPFIDFHFEIATFDSSSGRVALVSPTCVAYQVLDDGTLLCRSTTSPGSIEVRSPTGQSHLIHMTTGSTGTNAAYNRLAASADGKRVMVARDGATDPVINYQIALADLTASSATVFGPLDFVPDIGLPDGRMVADHTCVFAQWGGGPCNESLDGTYLFSSDGSAHTLFFKLAQGSQIAGYV